MVDPRLIVLGALLGTAGIYVGTIVAFTGLFLPWAYPRNVLGIQDRFFDRFGWLPRVDGDANPVETAIATLVWLAFAAAMLAVSVALVPTV